MLVLLSVALAICARKAYHSDRPVARDVSYLMLALLLPVVGNTIIIISGVQTVSYIGCYMYYLGMDIMAIALMRFTTNYCAIDYQGSARQKFVIGLLAVDCLQLLLNPITGHAFRLAEIIVEGTPYFALVPLFGQLFHRVAVYGVFLTAVGVFVYKVIKASRFYVERYIVILATMIIGGAWQTYYIVSGTPVDRSMIGFGVFGLLIFYFALYYRPVRLLDSMLAGVVSDMTEAVLFLERDGTCIYANDAANAMFGVRTEHDLKCCPEQVEQMVGHFDRENNWSTDCSTGQDNYQRFWHVDYHVLEDKKGSRVGSFLSLRDRTVEEEKLRREKYLASHDRLTGLFNKDYLYERIRAAIDENPDTSYRIFTLDVKDFKLINDIYGKDFGDKVLQVIAKRIEGIAVPGAVYGRISGDKFGCLAPTEAYDAAFVENEISVQEFAQKSMNQPIVMHFGVYDVTEPDLPVSVMFDRTFMAIASIKNDYQHHVAFYDDSMREDVLWNQKISGELDSAIANGQLKPYLQPLVNDQGEIEGAEVLVRWIHPDEGFLPPFRFIPYFEENGRIAQLDKYMWDCACRILKDWDNRGIDLFLSVNISPKDFYFVDVYKTISDLVKKHEVNPTKLRLEITETVMMSDLENRLRIIESLRNDGFLVEMDDFGSGYSSLNMLKDVPVDVLKIDMMFLYQTKDQLRAQTILQTIIDLSEQLGIPSITEGVETVDQLRMLVDMGCRLFQGYYFAKPMPLEEFESAYVNVA